MKTLIIGGYGQIGSIIVDKLHAQNPDSVIAGLRKDEQVEEYQSKGITTAKLDLSGDIEHLAKAMEGVDKVVFAAGSGGHTGADKTMMIDFDGAVKSIEAAKQAGIAHYVMISARRADRREFWSYADANSDIGSYYFAAKYYADYWLLNSGLNYTIIRPTVLKNETGNGTVTAIEHLPDEGHVYEIPREDVASTVIEVLNSENTINKAFDLTYGEETIADAIKALN